MYQESYKQEKIYSYLWWTLYISFNKVTTVPYIFVIHNIARNIIGANMLKRFDLSLDLASINLVQTGCNFCWELQTKAMVLNQGNFFNAIECFRTNCNSLYIFYTKNISKM